MSLLINILVLTAMVYLIGRKQPDQIIFYTGLALKIAAGMALGWIYFYYYEGGDTTHYWSGAQDLIKDGWSEWFSNLSLDRLPGFRKGPRAILFAKIVSGFAILTRGNYWIVSAYFSLISFLAYWYFYRQIRTTLPNLKWPVVVGFLLVPSTILWSAGIIKGALANAAIVFLAAFTLKLFFKKKVHLLEALPILTAFLILFYLKYYILIILLPAMLYVLFDRWAFKTGLSKPVRGGFYLVIIVATIGLAPSLNPNVDVSRLPEMVHRNQQKEYDEVANIPTLIDPTWQSLLSTAPKAIFIGLFGPTFSAPGGILSIIPKIENVLILIMSLFSLFLLFKQKLLSPDILVVGTMIFILTLAAMLPLAAPNYGALVRYKAAFTPFLVTLVLILPTWWMQKKLNC